jgi:lysophospholipase L1-like esterase
MLRKVLARLALLGFGLAGSLLLLEMGLRGVMAARIGPDVLLYGTSLCCGPKERLRFDPEGAYRQLSSQSHTVGRAAQGEGSTEFLPDVGGYRKYEPFQTRLDFSVDGESFEVLINRHGFRGEDFSPAKAPDTARVVTLGASSTFGYRARDDETYPVYMEELLNARLAESGCGDVAAFEVINLGIPHLWTGQILALLKEEGLSLDPDFVTLYAGMNDAKPSGKFRDRTVSEGRHGGGGWLGRAKRALGKLLREHLISVAIVDNLTGADRKTLPIADLDRYVADREGPFLENVRAMERASREAGAVFIPASQQAHHSSYDLPEPGVSYREEVARIERLAASHDEIRDGQFWLLTHARLMEELREWVAEGDVPFVDAIAATDARRDLMASYVHLQPAANRMIAEAFADEIWRRACTPARRAGLP